MEYKEQKLVKGVLNTWFNTIHNCNIVRPTWNKKDSYWAEFFIEKRKPLCLETTVTGEILDTHIIETVEYILVRVSNTVKLMYKNWASYTQLWTTRNITDWVTPLHFIKGVSWIWETLVSTASIGDAFFSLHDKWTYNAWTTYVANDVVSDTWVYYVSISWSLWVNITDTNYWTLYNTIDSWMDQKDPSAINYNDTFVWWYLAIKLVATWIRAIVEAISSSVHRYILFDKTNSNLQWVCTEIFYVKPAVWSQPNEAVVYIKWTNQAGSRPQYSLTWTETVKIVTDSWWVPIIATNDWVYSYNPIVNWSWVITWVTEIELIKLTKITDICVYNGSIFVLNDKFLYYSKATYKWDSDINIYPNNFINIKWWNRAVPFWKMMIVFWINNKVITPINWTTWNIGFVGSDLSYNNNLYTKYSIVSNMWMLYAIQWDKQLVKIDVTQINNISYQIETSNVLDLTKWLLDDIWTDIHMWVNEKELYITDYRSSKTYLYKYNTEYSHWSTYDYWYKINIISNNRFFWTNIYNLTGTVTETWVQQILWFTLWTEDLYRLHMVYFIKIIFWIEDTLLDYTLGIEYEIGWRIMYKTIDLTSYAINQDIYNGDIWLWDSIIWTTLLWTSLWWFEEAVWTFISPNIWIAKTWALFRFVLKSKTTNSFVYWWSVIWFVSSIPEVTEYWYKH
jgi:hypothetical protein